MNAISDSIGDFANSIVASLPGSLPGLPGTPSDLENTRTYRSPQVETVGPWTGAPTSSVAGVTSDATSTSASARASTSTSAGTSATTTGTAPLGTSVMGGAMSGGMASSSVTGSSLGNPGATGTGSSVGSSTDAGANAGSRANVDSFTSRLANKITNNVAPSWVAAHESGMPPAGISISTGNVEGDEITSQRAPGGRPELDGEYQAGASGASGASVTSGVSGALDASALSAPSSEASAAKAAEPSKLDELVQKLKKARADADPARLHLDLKMLQDIAMIFVAASVGGVLASILQINISIGYIIGGFFIGPSSPLTKGVFEGHQIVHRVDAVHTLAMIGPIFLLFQTGMMYAGLRRRGNLRELPTYKSSPAPGAFDSPSNHGMHDAHDMASIYPNTPGNGGESGGANGANGPNGGGVGSGGGGGDGGGDSAGVVVMVRG
mmetsp:Transcript_17280/g.40526  ORF Transcript_17280/g.40526 Transcript_17280/m.40526 type:complete len:438 (-) Transcript_17280:79-1392(-)